MRYARLLPWVLPVALAVLHMPVARTQQGVPLTPDVRAFVAIDASTIALTRVRVVDGSGAPARDNQTVVIRGGLIDAVGPAATTSIPADATVLDRPGHTVFPGIVGMHNHLGLGWDLDPSQDARLYLAAGVTTIRTAGTYEPYRDINLKRDIDEGRRPGPRIYLTSPYLTGKGPQRRMAQVSTPEEARRFVDYWAAEGVSWIKVYTRLKRRELEATIQQSRARGLGVMGHLCAVTAGEAAELGIDNLEHGLSGSDLDPQKPPDVCAGSGYRLDPDSDATKAALRALVEKGVALTATLAEREAYEPHRPAADARVFDFVTPRTQTAYRDQRAQYDRQRPGLARALLMFRTFVEAGGLLAAGIDPVYPALLPGFADQRNYELLVEGGFGPSLALRIMTLNGARVLGVDERLGTIHPEKIADLVVVNGDPTVRPEAIREVVLVFKDGVAYDPEKLRASVRQEIRKVE